MGDVHLLPMTDHIGDLVIRHGERDDLDPAHPRACLCGVPDYMECPQAFDWLHDLVLYPADPTPQTEGEQ